MAVKVVHVTVLFSVLGQSAMMHAYPAEYAFVIARHVHTYSEELNELLHY